MVNNISAPELAEWLNDANKTAPLLLDVRELAELQICQIAASLHIPMGDIPSRFNELDPDAPIVCICHHGMRSMQVARFLAQHDFSNVMNLTGGVHAWALQIEPTMATY